MLEDYRNRLSCDGCNDFYLEPSAEAAELAINAHRLEGITDALEICDDGIITNNQTIFNYLQQKLANDSVILPKAVFKQIVESAQHCFDWENASNEEIDFYPKLEEIRKTYDY